MKIDNKYLVLTLLASIIGFWLSKYFFNLTVSQLNLHGANVINLKNDFLAEFDLMFAFTIGLLPLMYLITDKFGKLQSAKQTYIVLAIIFISGIIIWQFKIISSNKTEDMLAAYLPEVYNVRKSISIDSLKLGKYFAIGCFLGTVLSSFIFRKINKVRIEK